MLKNYKKGFTLIELLVVIAIIGVLASVVLAATNSARTKGADASIKANLANMRAQAALYYDTNNTYGNSALCNVNTSGGATSGCTGVFGTGTDNIRGMLINATAQGGGTNGFGHTSSNGSAWAAAVQMKGTNIFSSSSGTDYFCVDSTGAAKVEDTITNWSTGFTVCP